MLIGQFEAETGESETACADRWRMAYGLTRAGYLAEILAKTNKGPVRAYYRGVGVILTQFTVPRKKQNDIPRDPIRYFREPGLKRDRADKRNEKRRARTWEEKKIKREQKALIREIQKTQKRSRAPSHSRLQAQKKKS